MNFADLGLSDELLRAVETSGYTEPTAIQAAAIPSVLMMRDLIGIAQTGTGKTASFVLPMIDILAQGRSRARMPRSLILEPTRELAAQVAENFEKYGKNHKLSMALLIGGVQMGDQVKALEKGVDVLIATPGRLMDLFQRGKILLTGCELLVIDEADRMLDMGFIPDIEEICTKLPKSRQTLLFSATMPPPIKKLADRFLSNPKTIEVSRPASTNLNIAQHLVPTTTRGKRDVLTSLLGQVEVTNAIIFCNRKTTVRELNKTLRQAGYKSGEIHGDMEQPQRIAELDLFKTGAITILVASDVAARGLDIKGVSHVFNFDAPWHPDDYVHRIGRTGRAGATGTAYTLITSEDAENIANIEKLTGQSIPRLEVAPEGRGRARSDEPREEAPRRAAREDTPRREPREDTPRRASREDSPRRVRRGGAARPEAAVEAAAPVEAVAAPVAQQDREPREERAPREARAPREERAPREDRAPRVEREARPERAPREDRAPRPERAARSERETPAFQRDTPRPDRNDRRPRRDQQDDGPDNGGWNGPMPSFLDAKFGY